MQTNDLCWIELLEIELFDHLIVYKKIDWSLNELLVIFSNHLELFNFVGSCLQIIYI